MSFSKYLLCAMLQVRGGCIDSSRGYQKKIAFLSLDMKTGDSSSFLTPLGIIYTLSQASQVALVVKNLPATARDTRNTSSVSGSGRSPAGGHGNPLQYTCLENPTDRGAWWATVHRVAKSQTWLKRLSMHAHIHQANTEIWIHLSSESEPQAGPPLGTTEIWRTRDLYTSCLKKQLQRVEIESLWRQMLFSFHSVPRIPSLCAQRTSIFSALSPWPAGARVCVCVCVCGGGGSLATCQVFLSLSRTTHH